jgi:hypothetical protein
MQNTAEPIDAEVKARLSAALKSFFEEERNAETAVKVLSKLGVNASGAEGLAKSWVRTGDYLFDSMAV